MKDETLANLKARVALAEQGEGALGLLNGLKLGAIGGFIATIILLYYFPGIDEWPAWVVYIFLFGVPIACACLTGWITVKKDDKRIAKARRNYQEALDRAINADEGTTSREDFLKHPKMQDRLNQKKDRDERQKAETEKRAQELALEIQYDIEKKIQTGDFPSSYVWLDKLHETNRTAIRIAEKVLEKKYLEKGWDRFWFSYNEYNAEYFSVCLRW